jgi:hypothetical protein
MPEISVGKAKKTNVRDMTIIFLNALARIFGISAPYVH